MTTTSVTPLAKLPSTSTFSFTAPFQQPQDPSSSVSLTPHKQQRRVSLALPSSPRQFPAWSFRDDTSVGVAAAAPSPLVPEKKGKMRRIANDDSDIGVALAGASVQPQSSQAAAAAAAQAAETAKKQRRKWTDEETKMLVDGCQKVRALVRWGCVSALNPVLCVSKWGVGNWKAILNDPELKFDSRSPVDLKDR